MKIKIIRDFGAVYILKYTYPAKGTKPKHEFFDVCREDGELIDTYKTARQAKKFCRRLLSQNFRDEDIPALFRLWKLFGVEL